MKSAKISINVILKIFQKENVNIHKICIAQGTKFSKDQGMMLKKHVWVKDHAKCQVGQWILMQQYKKFIDMPQICVCA